MECRQLGFTEVSVTGALAGQARRPGAPLIALLVTALPGVGLMPFVRLQERLRSLLGHPVDVIVRGSEAAAAGAASAEAGAVRL